MIEVSMRRDTKIGHANAYLVTVIYDGIREHHVVWTGSDGTGLWEDGVQIAGRFEFSAGARPAEEISRFYQGDYDD